MSSTRTVLDDSHFHRELNLAHSKLVVVAFTANWCGPCQLMAPVFQQLATRYTNAVFIKIDADVSPSIAAEQGASVMPTFMFYRDKTKMDKLVGADPIALENKVRQHYGDGDGSEGDGVGYIDLSLFIMRDRSECLNESDDNRLPHCLHSGDGFLQSDSDEQLIISLAFNQAVNIYCLKIKAPTDKGPKNIKIFVNQPKTIDFDIAEARTSSAKNLQICPYHLEGNLVDLQFMHLQSVKNFQMFVKDNQCGGELTQIDYLQLIGSPVESSNRKDYKRVIGKRGRRHI